MRIRTVRLIPYRIPLKRAWQSAAGGLFERTGWLIELETNKGEMGYGECAPLPAAGTETPEAAEQWFQTHLSGTEQRPPREALEALPPPDRHPAARCGIETALLDLIAQAEGLPLHRWLNPDAPSQVCVNASLGTLDDGAPSRARAALKQGFSVLKLKVGIAAIDQELEWLQGLCRALPSTARLRLDANRAWDREEALRFLQGIQGLPVESLEEPLSQPEPELLAELQESAPCTLALDESLTRLKVEPILKNRAVRRLILKPMVQGGLLPSLELAQRAKRSGIDSVVTTTLDSTVGVWSATQLAAAVTGSGQPLCHGLATSDWLEHDLGPAPAIRHGILQLPTEPGLGFHLNVG